MSTPSSDVLDSISAKLACTDTPSCLSVSLAGADGSAIAVIATALEVARARMWVRPMRPAPMSPRRNGAAMSETPLGQVSTVVALVFGGTRETLGGPGQGVLLDD